MSEEEEPFYPDYIPIPPPMRKALNSNEIQQKLQPILQKVNLISNSEVEFKHIISRGAFGIVYLAR